MRGKIKKKKKNQLMRECNIVEKFYIEFYEWEHVRVI
jgi:hypothetical protein